MSIPLLRDPERLHDLVDDLESHFWVSIYGALTRFLRGGPERWMAMFNEESTDKKGRVVGGSDKYAALWSTELHREKYTCPALQQLILTCTVSWMEYQLLKRGSVDLGEGTAANMKVTADLASQPSYWIEKFAFALDQAKSCCTRGDLPNTGQYLSAEVSRTKVESPRIYAGRKRRSGDNDEAADETDAYHIPLRRSKRIRQF